MAGAKGRSGRKKLPRTQLREALDRLEGDIPELLERLKLVAHGRLLQCPECGAAVDRCPGCGAALVLRTPDVEAAKYLVDRILGKPVMRQELDVLHTVQLTAGQCRLLLERGAQAHNLFLEGAWEVVPALPALPEGGPGIVPDDD